MTLFYPPLAHSAPSIDIVAKQRVIVAQTRGIVTLPFSITNRTNKAHQLVENIDLPEGWRLLANAGIFTLAGGESTLRLVHVLAPSDVPAGKYNLPYQVESRDNLAVRAEKSIAVVIKSTSELSVEIVDKPDLVLAGEQYTIKVMVRNKGNEPLSLVARLKNTSPYITTFTPQHLNIRPSKEALITITAKIPASLKKSSFHNLKLLLRSKTVFVDKTIKTRIVSLTPEGTGLYHTIPTKVTTIYTNNGNRDALQTEITAVGILDEKGEHHLDLLYRDMKTNTISSLGSNSEKRIFYNNSALSLRLGDQSYPLTGITGDGFYGKGVDINYHPTDKDWNIRVLSAQYDESDEEGATDIQGFEVGYQVSQYLKLTANQLMTNNDKRRIQKETITGLDLHWNKYDAAEIRLSLAKDQDGRGFRLRQEGFVGKLNYDLQIQNADADFDGYIKDIKSESLTAVVSFNKNRNYLRTNVYHARNNLNNDKTKRIREEKTIRFGVGHYFNNPQRDSLYSELFLRQIKDLRTEADHDQFEKGLRVQYQKNVSQSLRFNTTLEHIETNNRLTNKITNDNRGSLTLAYIPNDKYQFGFNIDTTNNSNNLGFDTNNTLRYGLNAVINFNSRQRLSGYWSHSGNNNLQINYNYIFNNGITFGASVAKDTLSPNNKLSYLLKISVPFDTPLYKYDNISSLKGTVFNKELQRPVSHAIVGIAGQFAVTDEKGDYLFKAIREGEYDLTTNLTKTKLDNYLIENEQQRITLIANKSKTHNISLLQGTGIKGRVQAYKASRGSLLLNSKTDDLELSGGIKNLLVTLISLDNNDDKVHKALTSEGGFFNFNGIKAGKWSIQVTDPRQLITESRIKEPQRYIDLDRGEEQDILFKAVPLFRQIKKVGPSIGFSVSGD